MGEHASRLRVAALAAACVLAVACVLACQLALPQPAFGSDMRSTGETLAPLSIAGSALSPSEGQVEGAPPQVAGQAEGAAPEVAGQAGLSGDNGASPGASGAKTQCAATKASKAQSSAKGKAKGKAKRANIKEGVYELRWGKAASKALAAKSALPASASKLTVAKRNSLNEQKFVIRKAGGGYYRIGSALSNRALSVKAPFKAKHVGVRMEAYKGRARQLWKAERLSGGRVRFVNKACGLALASKPAAAATAGAAAGAAATSTARRVLLEAAHGPNSAQQGFKLVGTKVNLQDRAAYVAAAESAAAGTDGKASAESAAAGTDGKASAKSALTVSNKVRGYSLDKRKLAELKSAVDACSFALGFLMIDCNTGMTVSYRPDTSFYAASTIKALYTTYLFESELEPGRLSLGSISGLVQPTIVWSNNDTYLSLRARYGSSAGFGKWLSQVNVGHLGTWATYTPRTFAKAWVNMLAYSNSKGKHVAYWKRTFNHSYMSSIHDALGSYRTTYSKPGWMGGGTRSGLKLNDGGIVDDRKGRQYLLAIMTSANPWGQKGKVQRVVKALDAIHMDMPAMR